jgi:hypothetical protein
MSRKRSLPETSTNGNGDGGAIDFPFGANVNGDSYAAADAGDKPGLTPIQSDDPFDAGSLRMPADEPGDEPADPFDAASLRLTPTLEAGMGVKTALLAIQVRKPKKGEFIRAHHNSDYHMWAGTLEIETDGQKEIYLLHPTLWSDLEDEPVRKKKLLVTCVTRQNKVFLWPLNEIVSTNRRDTWNRTAMEAFEYAKKGWVRVHAEMGSGAYEVKLPTTPMPDPAWPDLTFNQILKLAFREFYIETSDHPVLKQLRGEA